MASTGDVWWVGGVGKRGVLDSEPLIRADKQERRDETNSHDGPKSGHWPPWGSRQAASTTQNATGTEFNTCKYGWATHGHLGLKD